jgi:perosamine synthetase
MNNTELSKLAMNGGPKTRTKPFPGRSLIGPEEKAAVNALFDKAISTGEAFGYNGVEEEEYCKEFAEYMGGGYADAVNSGTSAVYVALRALDIEPFTEVIVSAITDPGGMMPVALMNCIPVVADSAPGKYNTDAEQIEKLISPLTSAIVVSHIGGEPCDIDKIVALGKKHNIPVVEDCSQSHGAKLNGKLLGTFGDIAAFSTMFGKHHCTGGQGGIVYTKREDLYWKIRRASDRGKPFGLPAGSTNVIASLNLNLNDLSAVIGREQLKKLSGIVEDRCQFVEKLKEGFKDLKTLIIPGLIPGAEPSYWWWRLEVNTDMISCDKETYCRALIEEGISLNPSYRAAIPHNMDWFKNRSVFGTSGYPWAAPEYKGDRNRQFSCPNAMLATERQFNLTVYESWGDEEAEDIITAFKKVENAFIV